MPVTHDATAQAFSREWAPPPMPWIFLGGPRGYIPTTVH